MVLERDFHERRSSDPRLRSVQAPALTAPGNLRVARDPPRVSPIRERSLRLHAARASALQKGPLSD